MEQNIQQPPSAPTGGQQNTAMAVVAYILFFIPLLTGDAQKDEYVKYHTKQGLVLFLTVVLINIIDWIIPFYFITWLLSLGTLVLLIIGIMNAVNGKKEPLPLIGKFSDVFKF